MVGVTIFPDSAALHPGYVLLFVPGNPSTQQFVLAPPGFLIHALFFVRTRPEFVQVTNAGMRESHVHDVTITKEAPNYKV